MKIGVLWDLDGTLLDSLEDIADSTNHTLAHFGLPGRSLEEIRRFVGNGAGELIRLALPGEPDDPTLSQVLSYYQAYYRTHAGIKTRPYGGVVDALRAVEQKHPVAVVSNKPDAATKLLCAGLFPGVYAIGESSLCPRKPAADMVHKAMEVLGVDGCVYVGDSEVDVLTAKNANVPCLSVLWGFRDQKTLEAAGAAYFCEKTADLPAVIETIIGEVYGK